MHQAAMCRARKIHKTISSNQAGCNQAKIINSLSRRNFNSLSSKIIIHSSSSNHSRIIINNNKI